VYRQFVTQKYSRPNNAWSFASPTTYAFTAWYPVTASAYTFPDINLYNRRQLIYMKVNIYWKKNFQSPFYFSHINKLPSESQNIRNFILARSPPPPKKRFTQITNILYHWHLIYASGCKIFPTHSRKSVQVTYTAPLF
jgi:hypothetical protein